MASGQNLYAEALRVGLKDGDQTIAASDYKKNNRIWLTGASVPGRAVALPAVADLKLVVTDSENAYPVTVRMGATEISLDPGVAVFLESDGTANGLSDVTGAPEQYGFSDALPLPDAGEGDPGSSVHPARSDHVHPSAGNWQTQDDDFTAESGNHSVDCRTNTVVATLDPDPDEGDTVLFADDFKSWGTHAFAVDPNGKTVMGDPAGCTASSSTAAGMPNWGFGLRFTNDDWRILL